MEYELKVRQEKRKLFEILLRKNTDIRILILEGLNLLMEEDDPLIRYEMRKILDYSIYFLNTN